MKSTLTRILFFLLIVFRAGILKGEGWVRVNQLGYLPVSVKVAVYISDIEGFVNNFTVNDASTSKPVFNGTARLCSGADWGMKSAARLDFSEFTTDGTYYIYYNSVRSVTFRIAADVYNGSADFLLRYMRQQRCGYNPFYGDTCHTHDGFIVDHPSRTGELIDATGGWHDASDYLQYVTTSANAVYQMLFAYSRNPESFRDEFKASGDPGTNGIPDILDEAKWGLDWLLKMNPDSGVMFNQIADDRDHAGFRLPQNDKASYGNGLYRPVYFVTGKKQGLGKFKNRTTGVSSTAGKFASAFALASGVYAKADPALSEKLKTKAIDAWEFGLTDPGVTQTACTVSPYFYEEDNYVDDLELAAAELFRLTGDSSYLVQADYWGTLEPVMPWIEKDTARHYQFYPFINMGHPLIGNSATGYSAKYIAFMRKGLQMMEEKRRNDPFRIKIPFLWCSNNYIAAALTQHRLYAEISGDRQFEETEAALRDWLFGCNPWGTTMIVGFPAHADYPELPHSSLTVIEKKIPLGGLIDGPVYSRIYGSLKGLTLLRPDPYAAFQNGRAVYHDDIGDYSTNEPTMDGTACLTYYLSGMEKDGKAQKLLAEDMRVDLNGAIIRKGIVKREIHLIFSADEFGEGADQILDILKKKKIKGSFFLTGNFLRNPAFSNSVKRMVSEGHFVGPHSDKHLLYNDWVKRDSLLVTKEQFNEDLQTNYIELTKKGINDSGEKYFLAPYEWYNKKIASWCGEMGVKLINLTPGTATNADYTTPDMPNYQSSDQLIDKLKKYESTNSDGLNGAFVLIHLGTDPARTDKLYKRLGGIIDYYESKGYTFKKL